MHTIVSGKYVREIFMNDNFDFMKGAGKVHIHSYSFHMTLRICIKTMKLIYFIYFYLFWPYVK